MKFSKMTVSFVSSSRTPTRPFLSGSPLTFTPMKLWMTSDSLKMIGSKIVYAR